MNKLQMHRAVLELLEAITSATPANIKAAGEEMRKQVSLNDAENGKRAEYEQIIADGEKIRNDLKQAKAEHDSNMELLKKANGELENRENAVEAREEAVKAVEKKNKDDAAANLTEEARLKKWASDLEDYVKQLEKGKAAHDEREAKITAREEKMRAALEG